MGDLMINLVKGGAHGVFVGQKKPELLQPPGVVALLNPQVQVSSGAVFDAQVFHQAQELTFAIQVGIIRQPVLQSPAHNGFGINLAVGFGQNAAVDGARRLSARCAVVFGGIGHDLDFLWREPPKQPVVVAQDASTHQVVPLAPLGQAQVVIGGGHKHHGGVHVGEKVGQAQALGHHMMDVLAPMPGIEVVIAGHNLLFEETGYFIHLPHSRQKYFHKATKKSRISIKFASNLKLIIEMMKKFLTLLLMVALPVAAIAATPKKKAVAEPKKKATAVKTVKTPAKTAFIVISKKDLNLKVYDRVGKDTVLLAQFPACLSKNKGNKQRVGDMRTPESPAGKPFKITAIQDASTWKHDFKDGRGNIKAYGHWFLRLLTPGHSGIGIHGSTNNESSVPGRASEGCIRLRDADIITLKSKYAYVGMPVIIKAEEQGLLPWEVRAKKK